MPLNVDGEEVKVPILERSDLDRGSYPDGGLAIEYETGALWTSGSDISSTWQNSAGAGLGWEFYTDSDTEGSPQELIAGQDNVITLDAQAIIAEAPNGERLWDVSTSKITPISEEDSYVFRLSFAAKIANSTGYYTVKVDIGGSEGVIFSRVNSFPKGANTEHVFSSTNIIFTRETFINNGGQIKINPSHTMDIYNKSLLINRVYRR
jgi:hypothetical protein